MRLLFLSFFLLFAVQVSFGQTSQGLLTELNGTPISEKSGVEIEGSPYLQDSWSKGDIRIGNKVFNQIELKYNVVKDELIFKKDDGVELVFNERPMTFSLNYKGAVLQFEKGFEPIENYSKESYYQVFNSPGKLKLLKKNLINVIERKQYNSATATRTYFKHELYFVADSNNRLVKVRKDKKELLKLFGDKADKMSEFMATSKINIKDDNQLGKAFDYYNSL